MKSEEQIVQALIAQAEANPIGAFGEIGSWDYITKDERKVFRAVGRAHLATNIPIYTHTGIPGKFGRHVHRSIVMRLDIGNLKLRLNFQCSPAVGTDAACLFSVVHSRHRERGERTPDTASASVC
jgi:hypothetical protein